MTTIKLTEEENIILDNLPFMDYSKQWKFMNPYYYKVKDGYYEIYNKDEYYNELET